MNPALIAGASAVAKNKYLSIAIGIAFLVVIVIVLRSVFKIQKGITTAADDFAQLFGKDDPEVAALRQSTAFDPTYYKTVGSLIKRALFGSKGSLQLYTYATQRKFANQLYNGLNGVNIITDSLEVATDVFSRLRSKAEVSQLADIFSRIHGINLLQFLENELYDSEMKQIKAMVDKLPNYNKV